MSLFKIPFVLANLVGTHITCTPPVSPALEHERKSEPLRLSRAVPYTKCIFWVLALTEIAAIVASYNAQLPISQKVLGVMLLTQNAGGIKATPLSTIGALLSFFGGAVRLSCYRWMGKHFTFDVSIRDHHKLITTGPYGIVRHPGYTGALMNVLGLVCFHASPGSLLRESEVLGIGLGRVLVGLMVVVMLVPVPFLRHRMRMEDMALKQQFGQDWDEWAERVPYWLIPGIY
ncbi:hypothetical protein BDZ94DRAFT_1210880 [Collybia nuda]|uniref:Protein-S-isoprenylcysteine O-methyltransferase n=1 Tax=Collybia nuda TaxID=64659 RepID=A0A9P5YCT0_9AGAR|nr:hypothetical protein BDZ94DRAFT_1210880 [Collybia nuda]